MNATHTVRETSYRWSKNDEHKRDFFLGIPSENKTKKCEARQFDHSSVPPGVCIRGGSLFFCLVSHRPCRVRRKSRRTLWTLQ